MEQISNNNKRSSSRSSSVRSSASSRSRDSLSLSTNSSSSSNRSLSTRSLSTRSLSTRSSSSSSSSFSKRRRGSHKHNDIKNNFYYPSDKYRIMTIIEKDCCEQQQYCCHFKLSDGTGKKYSSWKRELHKSITKTTIIIFVLITILTFLTAKKFVHLMEIIPTNAAVIVGINGTAIHQPWTTENTMKRSSLIVSKEAAFLGSGSSNTPPLLLRRKKESTLRNDFRSAQQEEAEQQQGQQQEKQKQQQEQQEQQQEQQEQQQEQQEEVPIIYDCIDNILSETIYKLENLNLPSSSQNGFSIHIMVDDEDSINYFNITTTRRTNATFPQLVFLLPNGFGGPELISGEEVMMVQDIQYYLALHQKNTTWGQQQNHPWAILEEFKDNNNQTGSNYNFTRDDCPSSSVPSSFPTTSQPSLSPSITSSPSKNPSKNPSETPSNVPTMSYPPSSEGLPSSSPVQTAFLPSGLNAYNNTNSMDGPWSECLGWEGQDCQDYIRTVVTDTPRFQFLAVRWKHNDNVSEDQNNNNNDNTDGNNNSNEEELIVGDNTTLNSGEWQMIGFADREGHLLPQNYHVLHRVVIVVNNEGIVVNNPSRG